MTDELPLPLPFALNGSSLQVEGVEAESMAREFGTPFYVTSEARVRDNARRFYSAFKSAWSPFRLLYAVKANPNPAIVRILASEGLGADCSSPAELRLARELGIVPSNTLYTSAYPSPADLELARASGVTVNLDDPALLDPLLQSGLPAALSFRLNPGTRARGPEGLLFSGRNAKFGTTFSRARWAYRRAARAGVEHLGLHTMPGSNVLDPAHFGRVARFLGRCAGELQRDFGIDASFLDLGGGFGVPYRPTEKPLDLQEVARGVAGGLREELPGGLRPALLCEPGRFLVADSTLLITRVTHVKRGRTPWVGVDAGMHTLLRPALYGAYHPIYPVVEEGRGFLRRVRITGPVCENTDVLARDRMVPDLRPGDLVAIGNAGAYGFSMASQYNTRPRPAEVLVAGGRAHLIREPESYRDLFARARVPAHLAPASSGNPFPLASG